MWHIFGSQESEPTYQNITFSPVEGNKVVVGEGSRTVRIVCVSDTHSQAKGLSIPEADVFVFAGDTINHRHGEPEFMAFCSWIQRVPCKEKFLVAGNHDFYLRDNKERLGELMPGVTVLEDSSAPVGETGLTIYGAPWTVGRNLFYIADAYEASESVVHKKWQQIPTGIDILVTHSPPWDVFDLTYKSKHIGSKYLRSEISTRIHPKIHIFGHNHDQSGMMIGTYENGDQTLFVNASVRYTRQPLLVEYKY